MKTAHSLAVSLTMNVIYQLDNVSYDIRTYPVQYRVLFCHSFLHNCCSFFKIVVRSFKLLFVLPIVVRSSQIVVHFSQIVVRYYQMYVVPPLLLLWYSRDSSCGHLIPAGGLDPKMLLPPSPFPPPPSPFHPLPSSQIVAGIFSHSYPL